MATDNKLEADFNPVKKSDDFGDNDKSQGVNHRIFTRTPGNRELGEGEIVFSKIGTVFRVHVKIKGILKSVVLT